MSSSEALLLRLTAVLAAVGTVAGCAERSHAPLEPAPKAAAPSSTPMSAPATGTGASSAVQPASPPPASTGGSPAPTSQLPACLGCTPLCYPHGVGEKCLPTDAGAALDKKVGCFVHVKVGPQDDGAQCCYAQPCKGRPVLIAGTMLVAPLVRDEGRWS